jgi:hypothetical protein
VSMPPPAQPGLQAGAREAARQALLDQWSRGRAATSGCSSQPGVPRRREGHLRPGERVLDDHDRHPGVPSRRPSPAGCCRGGRAGGSPGRRPVKYSFCTSITSRARFIGPPLVGDARPAPVAGCRAGRPGPTRGSSQAVGPLSRRDRRAEDVNGRRPRQTGLSTDPSFRVRYPTRLAPAPSGWRASSPQPSLWTATDPDRRGVPPNRDGAGHTQLSEPTLLLW